LKSENYNTRLICHSFGFQIPSVL